MKATYALSTTALVALSGLANAHFNLDFPPARGFEEEKLDQFPCGGQNTVSSNRTSWPLTGGSIALTMGHIDANVEVLLAIGSTPGSAFNTIIRPTFTEQGLGAFCITGLTIPSTANITEGTLATIQVVTNGDPEGGLYNCADIIFTASAAAPGTGVCTNATGITTSVATVSGNPNVTSSGSNSTNGVKSGGSVVRGGGIVALVGGLMGVVALGSLL